MTSRQSRRAARRLGVDDVLPVIDDFAKRFPKDDRTPQLLFQLASSLTDKGKQADLYKKIQNDFPESAVAKKLEAKSKQLTIPSDRRSR